MPRKVFISYRVTDTRPTAGRLAADLRRAFGDEAVFLDYRSLDPAEQWPMQLDTEVAGADVVLVLIGKGWLTAQDEDGRRRIDRPDDWVRQEVAAGLRGTGAVLPLLVNDAQPAWSKNSCSFLIVVFEQGAGPLPASNGHVTWILLRLLSSSSVPRGCGRSEVP